jgi:hypothetical protein
MLPFHPICGVHATAAGMFKTAGGVKKNVKQTFFFCFFFVFFAMFFFDEFFMDQFSTI